MVELTHARLCELLHFQHEDGTFIWKISYKKTRVGRLAGHQHGAGYWSITIDKKQYLAHRLAWFYVFGEWPKLVLDHINRDRMDNRIKNLRSVSQKENLQNITLKKSNKTGANGVCFRTDGRIKPWQARVMHDRKEKSLGYFQTYEEAVQARQEWDQKFWSVFL